MHMTEIKRFSVSLNPFFNFDTSSIQSTVMI